MVCHHLLKYTYVLYLSKEQRENLYALMVIYIYIMRCVLLWFVCQKPEFPWWTKSVNNRPAVGILYIYKKCYRVDFKF